MTRRQRLITLVILCVLTIASAGMIGYVLYKEQPENVAAFENRFGDFSQLGLTADAGIDLNIEAAQAKAVWQAGSQALMVRTDKLPVAASKSVLVNLTVGGTQNAFKTERWNYRLWLELTTFRSDAAVGTHRIELPLESGKGRGRVYAVKVEGAADSYQVVLRVEPLNDTVSAGDFMLSKWEVYAK